MAWHTNRSTKPLKIYDFWVFNGTHHTETEIEVFQKHQGSVSRDVFVVNPNRSGSFASQLFWQPYERELGKGKQLSAACSLTQSDGKDDVHRYCSFYFMADVRDDNGNVVPMRRSTTIEKKDAQEYCRNPYPANYLLSEPEKYGDFDKCMRLLDQ